jgi:hypothetical protein
LITNDGFTVPCLALAGPDGQPQIATCWEFTDVELEEILKTGKVWVSIVGQGLPPILVTGNKPWTIRNGKG